MAAGKPCTCMQLGICRMRCNLLQYESCRHTLCLQDHCIPCPHVCVLQYSGRRHCETFGGAARGGRVSIGRHTQTQDARNGNLHFAVCRLFYSIRGASTWAACSCQNSFLRPRLLLPCLPAPSPSDCLFLPPLSANKTCQRGTTIFESHLTVDPSS